MRTENLTLLLTDIKGYTARTSQQTRAESRAWLSEHEALVLPVIEGFGGTRRKGVGDAIIATFPSPTNAALAAMAIQDRLWTYDRAVEERDRVEVRAVLTMGELSLEGGELLGEAPAMLLKLDKFASANEIILTEALYLAMNKAEVPAKEIGLKQVEGVSEAIKLFRVPPVSEAPEWAPYGGRALAQVTRLRRIDPAWIGELREDPKATLRKDLEALRPRPPLKRYLSIAVAVFAVCAAVFALRWSRSPVATIEEAIDQGRLVEAKAAIGRYLAEHPAAAGDGHYLRGRLALAEGKKGAAAGSFQKAIEVDPATYQSHPRIYKAIVPFLEDEDCDVRSAGAVTLGLLGDRRARGPLETALERERESSNFLSGLFCRFEARAEEALRRLE